MLDRNRDHTEWDRLYEICREAMTGPYSSFTAPPTVVAQKMEREGLAWRTIATQLRAWAVKRDGVRKVVIGHPGSRYMVAALIDNPTAENIIDTRASLSAFDEMFAPVGVDVYVMGPDYADTAMFYRYGTYVVHDDSAPMDDKAAA